MTDLTLLPQPDLAYAVRDALDNQLSTESPTIHCIKLQKQVETLLEAIHNAECHVEEEVSKALPRLMQGDVPFLLTDTPNVHHISHSQAQIEKTIAHLMLGLASLQSTNDKALQLTSLQKSTWTRTWNERNKSDEAKIHEIPE